MLSRKGKLVFSIISVLFLMILKYVIDHSAEVLPQILKLIAYVSLSITSGLITVSFCSLLGTFSDVEDSAVSHLLRRISEYPAINFFIGFVGTAYLNFMRPSLAVNVLFLPYMEWVTIALAVYMIYTTASPSTTKFYVNSEEPDWKKHTQEVRRETGRDLIHITSVMEEFVDYGVKESLLVYLVLHLQRLGETEEAIFKILSQLIDYREDTRRHKLYFLVFPWEKGKIAMRNKKAREDLLKTLIQKIDRL